MGAERCRMSQGRRHFTDEFKREAVALLVSSGRPLSRIASELGISPSMLRNWRTSQPHDAWPVLALDAYLLRCRDKAALAASGTGFIVGTALTRPAARHKDEPSTTGWRGRLLTSYASPERAL